MDRTTLLPSDERTASNQMIIPSSAVTDLFHDHRQRTLRVHHLHASARAAHGGLRVRIGHLLIAVGSSLSGDIIERPGRPSTMGRGA